MDEDAAWVLPQRFVYQEIVDKHITRFHVHSFLARHAGDHARAGKVDGGPAMLLLVRPTAKRAADDGVQVLDGMEELASIRQQWQRAVEVLVFTQPVRVPTSARP